MTLIRKLKRNKVSVAFGVAVVGCFLFNSSEIKKNMVTVTTLREAAQINGAKDMQLRLSQQQAQMQAEIANERYKNGCLIVVTTADPTLLTSLSEGQPVLDGARNTPLPIGTVVCDAHGNTAKIIPGTNGSPVAGEVAFTGNREIVETARKNSQARYTLPVVEKQ